MVAIVAIVAVVAGLQGHRKVIEEKLRLRLRLRECAVKCVGGEVIR